MHPHAADFARDRGSAPRDHDQRREQRRDFAKDNRDHEIADHAAAAEKRQLRGRLHDRHTSGRQRQNGNQRQRLKSGEINLRRNHAKNRAKTLRLIDDRRSARAIDHEKNFAVYSTGPKTERPRL